MVDSGNQKVNHVTQAQNSFEHNAYGVEAHRQATRPCNYCANCYSETILLKYTDSQILKNKQTTGASSATIKH